MQVLNTTAIASGYTGRDPQRETSDGSFFSKFSFNLHSIVKDRLGSSFSSLKEKKNRLKLS